MPEPTRVLVFGAGAVGSLFGGRLAASGHVVTLVGRSDHVLTIRERGLFVDGSFEGTFWPSAVTEVPLEPKVDLVLLTVKSYDLGEAGRSLSQRLSVSVPVLALQNGLGIEETVSHALRAGGWPSPERWIVRGVNTVPSTWIGPGHVRQAGDGEVLVGESEGTPLAPLESRFAHLLHSSGIRVRRVRDLRREVWRKALVNAAINPVTADHRVVNGKLLTEPWRGQALGLLREAQDVARAEGFDFTDEEADRELWKVVRATRDNRSSMLQDVEHGRPTEVEAISGAILQRAETHGLVLRNTSRAVDRLRRLASAPTE